MRLTLPAPRAPRVPLLPAVAGVLVGLLGGCGGAEPPAPREHPVQTPWRGPAVAGAASGGEVYSSCASCHHDDASGRPDGAIPRLAGQRHDVLVSKLTALQTGAVTLPVMAAFARSLDADEVDGVARYLAGLPDPPTVGHGDGTARDRGRVLYDGLCASCHGADGAGMGQPLAPRLCGQHAGYLERRMGEVMDGVREDADAAMAVMLRSLTDGDRAAIADVLSRGPCPLPAAGGVP